MCMETSCAGGRTALLILCRDIMMTEMDVEASADEALFLPFFCLHLTNPNALPAICLLHLIVAVSP